MNRTLARNTPAATTKGRPGFTLVELLTVIAIIALLIGLLVPAVGRARDQAKNAKTRATLKAMGDGLELFRSDNESEFANGYPSSRYADDPTESGTENNISGAQWLVRYLMGKDVLGYVNEKNGPRFPNVTQGWEQKGWYPEKDGDRIYARTGPYIQAEQVKLLPAKKLPRADGSQPPGDEKALEQLVALDVFNYPILYYAANAAQASRASAPIATYGDEEDGDGGYKRVSKPGIYNFKDNAMFTGQCKGSVCQIQPWDFTGDGSLPIHEIEDFGQYADDIPNPKDMEKEENQKTFVYYILNKNAFEQSGKKTLTPVRKDSFLLITSGKDGVYGTSDDVTNF